MGLPVEPSSGVGELARPQTRSTGRVGATTIRLAAVACVLSAGWLLDRPARAHAERAVLTSRRPGATPALLCPDGTSLPLLNGVAAAPPLARSSHLGPLAAVVRVVVDRDGLQWYVHADGSTTTTRPTTVWIDGVPVRDVETIHNAPIPARAARVRTPH